MCFSHHLQMGFYVSKSISQGTQMTYLQSSNVGHIIGKYKVMFPNDVYWFIPPSTIDIYPPVIKRGVLENLEFDDFSNL